MGSKIQPANRRKRPGRGTDCFDHADPAIAGLCPACRSAAGDRPVCLHGSPDNLCHFRNITLSFSGPVAVTSLMTLAAVAPIAAQGTPEYLAAAMALALLTGLILIVLGFLKLGFLIKFYELSGHGRIGHCRRHPDCRRPVNTGSGDSFQRRNISCPNHFVGKKLQVRSISILPLSAFLYLFFCCWCVKILQTC